VIFREIDRIVPRRRWPELTLLDAFLGGGSVSLYGKAQGFKVIATDIAERSIVIGKALIENSRVRLLREDVLRLLTDGKASAGRVESTMAPAIFTKEQARFIDTALQVASESQDPSKAALVRLLTMRMALLCHAYSQVRKGTIHRVTTGEFESITESAAYHYIDGLRLATPGKLWELAQQINAGVFQGMATTLQASVLDVLPVIQADVAYFDPPYPGVMSYEKEYRIIDEILEGASRSTSPFTAKNGASMLDTLFGKATHIPLWILSLGNAMVGIEELEAKMAKHGRQTKAIALKYQHLPAVATAEKKETNREFLVVGWDPHAPLLRGVSVGRSNFRDHAVGVEVDWAVSSIHADVDPGGSERAAAEPLPVNGLEKGDASLPEQTASEGRGMPVPELQPGVDDPSSILGEPGLDGDCERGLDTSGGHVATVPCATRGSQPVQEEG